MPSGRCFGAILAALGLLVAGCATKEHAATLTGPGTNQQRAEQEAAHLVALAVLPPGSARTPSAAAALSGPVLGMPVTRSLIDDHADWRVPMAAAATLAWLERHPPPGLAYAGRGSIGAASGLAYSAPDSRSWTGAELQIAVAATGPGTSVVRADGMSVWLDATPYPDSQTGPRMRVTAASGCPRSDLGMVGVANPGPPVTSSLVPASEPTGALVCDYAGFNGVRGALTSHSQLSAPAARLVAASARQIPLSHSVGTAISCPSDDGSIVVVGLEDSGGSTFDLWESSSGCPTVANGFILAAGSLTLP